MTDKMQSKSKSIFDHASELLDDIELSRLSGESLLLKAIRLARLSDAEYEQMWLVYELAGYPHDNPNPVALEYMGIIRRWTDYGLREGYRMPLAEIEATIAALKMQMQTLRIPDVSYSSSNQDAFSVDFLTIGEPAKAVVLYL